MPSKLHTNTQPMKNSNSSLYCYTTLSLFSVITADWPGPHTSPYRKLLVQLVKGFYIPNRTKYTSTHCENFCTANAILDVDQGGHLLDVIFSSFTH